MTHFVRRSLGLLIGAVIFASVAPNPLAAAGLEYLEIEFGSPTATLPLDRFLKHVYTVRNTDTVPHVVNFSIYVQETKQDVVGWPQPQTLYLDPGETETVITFLDERWGELDKNTPGNFTRTLDWTFEEQGSRATRKETVTYPYTVLKSTEVAGDMKITGTVVTASGGVAANTTVQLSTGPSGYTTSVVTQSDGSFSFPGLPSRSDWMLSAGGESVSAPAGNAQPGANCAPPPAPCNPPGNNPPTTTSSSASVGQGMAYVRVDPATSNYDLVLSPPQVAADYEITKSITADIGYWKGAVDDAETKFLVIDGMENWANPDLKRQAKLRLFDFSGTELWSYAMGWEGWGADLSGDGKYAAFTTSNPTSTLGILDAETGQPIWVKNSHELDITDVKNAADNGGIESKEITISSTNKYVGIGSAGGNFLVVDLLTGAKVFETDVFGQVRKIIFDEKDDYVYAGSGDGNAYKFKLSSGEQVWKAAIGSWPFTNSFLLSRGEKYLAAGGKTGEVTVINAETGAVLWREDHRGATTWLDFSPDGSYLVAGGGGQGATTLYETESGKQIWRVVQHSHQGRFSGDGKAVLIGDHDLTIVDLAGNTVGNILTPSVNQPAGAGAADGGQFAYITRNGSTIIYTHRDIQPGAISIVIANGTLTQTSAASNSVSSAADGVTDLAPYPNWLWGVVALVVLLAIGGAIAWKKLQAHHERPFHEG